MKYEWKKAEKALYLPPKTPVQVDVPEQKFFVLHGRGDPNGEAFGEAVGALYALSYTVKMLPRQGITPEGYFEYGVYPLEAVWDLAEEARGKAGWNKEDFVYDVMIRQPDFVDAALAADVIEMALRKRKNPLLAQVAFRAITDGSCVQMLHVGPYDDEPASFAQMDAFCAENGLERASKLHREIYWNDARKTAPEKLKTVIRYAVKR
ncbi:MAG: hypothetical protein GXY32_04735 [Ruminococcaceae bacterium]|nr:hypothetical protein [Oscillospiraceae bacterium]